MASVRSRAPESLESAASRQFTTRRDDNAGCLATALGAGDDPEAVDRFVEIERKGSPRRASERARPAVGRFLFSIIFRARSPGLFTRQAPRSRGWNRDERPTRPVSISLAFPRKAGKIKHFRGGRYRDLPSGGARNT